MLPLTLLGGWITPRLKTGGFFLFVFVVVVYAVAVGAECYALLYFFVGCLKSAVTYEFVDAVFFRPDVMKVNHRRVGEPALGTGQPPLKL